MAQLECFDKSWLTLPGHLRCSEVVDLLSFVGVFVFGPSGVDFMTRQGARSGFTVWVWG